MRPVASTCKVGTRFKGFVVKTRKANQHSNRRVKYWAKAFTSKPKPKKASKTPKSTRKAPTKRHKLMGGGPRELEEVLFAIKQGGGKFIDLTKCDDETASEIQSIGERAKDVSDNIKVVNQIKEEYKREVMKDEPTQPKRARLNALAIVMANISNAMHYHGISLAHKINVRNTLGKSQIIQYGPTCNIYDQIQAKYPVYVRRLVFQGVEIGRGAKFDDESLGINGENGIIVAV